MNGSFAAWLSSWSRQTPTKSRYISSTTGRMPAIAAPTPRPTIALSEIGVSRTRSPNRSCRPRVRPKTLPPARDVDAGDEHTLVVGELRFERGADRVHRAEHRSVGGAAPAVRPVRVAGARRSRSAWRPAASATAGPPRRLRRARCATDDCMASSASSVMPADRSRRAWTSSGSRASHSRTSSGDR